MFALMFAQRRIPGRLNDRRTPLGELNWIFTAITDTIAWNVLPRDLFQKLFRQDLLVASLFRNFLLAERIMRSYNCTPVSSPRLPPTYMHAMWPRCSTPGRGEARVLPPGGAVRWSQGPWEVRTRTPPWFRQHAHLPPRRRIYGTHFPLTRHSPFFAEQLTAFQVWLTMGVENRNPPEQLPIVLQWLLQCGRVTPALQRWVSCQEGACWSQWPQHPARRPHTVLLSQVHRLRALDLLGRFLDLGPWAVSLALSVGIFPYVLKLLQSSARELRPLLVFIWAKILAVDSVFWLFPRSPVNGVAVFRGSAFPRARASVACTLRCGAALRFRRPQPVVLNPAGQSCQADLVKDNGHKYFLSVLADPYMPAEHRTMTAFILAVIVNSYNTGQVRCAAVFALGTFVGNSAERTDHSTTIDHNVAMMLAQLINDGSPVVRKELVVALSHLVVQYESNFCTVALQFMEEEKNYPLPSPAAADLYPVVLGCPSPCCVQSIREGKRPACRGLEAGEGPLLCPAPGQRSWHFRGPEGGSLTPVRDSPCTPRLRSVSSYGNIRAVTTARNLNKSLQNLSLTEEWVSFNSVYTQIWRVLLHLAADPYPDVSDLAMKVLNSIAYKATVNARPQRILPTSSLTQSAPASPTNKGVHIHQAGTSSSSLTNDVAKQPVSRDLPPGRPGAAGPVGVQYTPHSHQFPRTRKMFDKGPDQVQAHSPGGRSLWNEKLLGLACSCSSVNSTCLRSTWPLLCGSSDSEQAVCRFHQDSIPPQPGGAVTAAEWNRHFRRVGSGVLAGRVVRTRNRAATLPGCWSTQSSMVGQGRGEAPPLVPASSTSYFSSEHRGVPVDLLLAACWPQSHRAGSVPARPTLTGTCGTGPVRGQPRYQAAGAHGGGRPGGDGECGDLQPRPSQPAPGPRSPVLIIGAPGHRDAETTDDPDDAAGHRSFISATMQTGFCDWSARYFAQPVMKMWQQISCLCVPSCVRLDMCLRIPAGAGPPGAGREETEAVSPGVCPGITRLDDQIFLNRNPGVPSVVKFHPFTPCVAVADKDSICFWDWEKGEKLDYFHNGNPRYTRVTAMEYLNGQDCSLLLTATDDGAIRVWKNFADLEKNPEMVTAWQGLSDMLPTTRGLARKVLIYLDRSKQGGAGMVVDWEQETGLLMSSGDVRIVRIWDTDREMKVQPHLAVGSNDYYISVYSVEKRVR
ncbi:raptor [Camelus ferus]|nr:raptor [Camelus ferus]